MFRDKSVFSITMVSLTDFSNKRQCCPQPGSKCCLGRSTAKSSFLSHLFSILSNSCVITKGVLEGGRRPHNDNFRLRSLCGNGRRDARVYIDHLGRVEGERKGGREVYHVRFIAGHKLPSFMVLTSSTVISCPFSSTLQTPWVTHWPVAWGQSSFLFPMA